MKITCNKEGVAYIGISHDIRDKISNPEQKAILEGVYHYLLMQDGFYKVQKIIDTNNTSGIHIYVNNISVITENYIFNTDSSSNFRGEKKVPSYEVVELLRKDFVFDE